MKISEEILRYLEIESFYIIQNDLFCMCMPLEVKLPIWKISVDTDELNIKNPAKFKIKTKSVSYTFLCELKKASEDDIYGFIYEIKVLETNSRENKLIKDLILLNSKIESWNHRKEIRYDIGVSEKNCQLMRFKTLEQNIIVEHINLPCVINNLSYSGAKITTFQGNFSKDKKIILNLSFVNPIEQIHLYGTIRNCLMKKASDKTIISVLSLEFIEAPISYKERLSHYINKLEDNND